MTRFEKFLITHFKYDYMIDWTKPIQTRDGRAARVISLSADLQLRDGNRQPVVVAVKATTTTSEDLCSCEQDGHFFPPGTDTQQVSDTDIINVPPPDIDIFINVYPDGGAAWAKAATANILAAKGRIALYRLSFSPDGILKNHERLQ